MTSSSAYGLGLYLPFVLRDERTLIDCCLACGMKARGVGALSLLSAFPGLLFNTYFFVINHINYSVSSCSSSYRKRRRVLCFAVLHNFFFSLCNVILSYVNPFSITLFLRHFDFPINCGKGRFIVREILYFCLFVCVYVCVSVFLCLCVFVFVNFCAFVSVCFCVFVHMSVCMLYVCVCMCIYVCMYLHVCMCMHVYICWDVSLCGERERERRRAILLRYANSLTTRKKLCL